MFFFFIVILKLSASLVIQCLSATIWKHRVMLFMEDASCAKMDKSEEDKNGVLNPTCDSTCYCVLASAAAR